MLVNLSLKILLVSLMLHIYLAAAFSRAALAVLSLVLIKILTKAAASLLHQYLGALADPAQVEPKAESVTTTE
jgi:hypothetical protein